MDVADAIAALSDIADVAATYASLWFTVTFAYLTVAYFVGQSMTRFQCLSVTALYAISAAIMGVAAMAHSHAWFLALADTDTYYNDTLLNAGGADVWITVGSLFMLGGTVLSLYFMYDVRTAIAKPEK